MPKFAQTITQTVQTTQTVQLTAQQTTRLRQSLHRYQMLQAKIKALEAEKKAANGTVEDIMAEVNVETLDFEGFKTSIVAGTRKSFDPELFVRKGGDLAVYQAAMVEKPVAAYVKVNCPKENE